MLGPVLIKYGNEAQKRYWLPRILNGEDWWCQGYSEPGAGSDLASLKTSAVRDGDHYIVNGQKTWTTLGQYANMIFCLVRTRTDGKPQEGISFLLIRQQLSAAAPAHGEAKAAEEKVEKGPPNYIPLDPAFVVNLEGADTRFLQVQVQMMTRDPKGGEELKVHEPRIRSALLMLFSQQQPQDIATREGKEKLQADVLAEIQKIMTEETGKPLVEAVYFTSFVTQ